MKLEDGLLLGIMVSFTEATRIRDANRIIDHFQIEVVITSANGKFEFCRKLESLTSQPLTMSFGCLYLPLWQPCTREQDISVKLHRHRPGNLARRALTIDLAARVNTTSGIRVFHARERVS